MPDTDAALIRRFMEPWLNVTTAEGYTWTGAELDLDALHQVESHLTGEQRRVYRIHVIGSDFIGGEREKWLLLHADAETKIRALASVLRNSLAHGAEEER